MKTIVHSVVALVIVSFFCQPTLAQTILYTMPEETEEHEGTWLQWPHNHLYGPYYRDDVEPTWIAMTNALQSREKVHIIAYDAAEQSHIISVLTSAAVPLGNVDFFVHETDDVWIRDNGPMFVYDQNDELIILDWGFNGWGGDTPYSLCDVIPQGVSMDLSLPRVDLGAMVLEGGAIEHDGNGTMMATRSSVTHSSRNPSLTETQIEEYITTNTGITKFIWLDGLYGSEITDMHIDGFVKFANDSTIVTMNNADLLYWEVTQSDIDLLYGATDINAVPYNFVYIPLTQNDVVTAYGTNLGYKGSYVNYYIANTVVLVPTYEDPNDAVAMAIIQGLYPGRAVVGIDVRNLYEYGGMVHCVTQQQPVDLASSGVTESAGSLMQLFQNCPNPFSQFTTIAFSVETSSPVDLSVYDAAGHLVYKKVVAENGSVNLDAASFHNGIYFYTLAVNGITMGSRRMIVIQ